MTKDSRRKSSSKRYDRLHIIQGVFFLLAVSIIWRLFDLQVLKGSTKLAEAFNQRSNVEELLPNRGEIYTIASLHNQDEFQPLAINEKRFLIYANPLEVAKPGHAAKLLAEIFELDQVELEAKLNKSDPYEPISHAVTESDAALIESWDLQGIYKQPETVRTYPMKNTFSHITGFLGFEDDKRVGQYGMEGFLENLLAGSGGYLESEQDPSGRLIALGERSFVPATHGANFVLTIDPNIQQKACSLIKKAQAGYQASGGTILVMEPDTGRIRAMCSVPNFDPNTYNEVEDIDVYINPATTGSYEPGSVFKPFTMAAALDSGSVKADTSFIDTGEIDFGDHVIRNADNKIYGEQTMSQVLENSINTGSVFAAMQTGRKVFRDYVKAFGFGASTGIEFPAESSGNISALEKKGEIFLATNAFGQGITVTPIQLVRAFSAIANKGELVKPRVIEKVIMADGNEHIVNSGEAKTVISAQTAAVLGAMLVNVTEKGQASSAQVAGYYIAGKTGTAQIASRAGGYSDETIHTFIGFAPISDPVFVALVKLDRPTWGRFSSNTVAPVFSDLATFLLQYYQVPPER
jgi:stage V sporulation protein D (sporulation-specific penicillin-binding protein)